MKKKHQNTLRAIFRKPTTGTLNFKDIESLLKNVGFRKIEGRGSGVKFYHEESGFLLALHSPHPQPEAKKWMVDEIRKALVSVGVTPG